MSWSLDDGKLRYHPSEDLKKAASAEAIRIYAAAIQASRARQQVVGENSDYYVTLEQLEKICKRPPSPYTANPQ